MKPAKPYPEFPLFPHDRGQWAKKIKGKMVYFGPWADPQAALAKFHQSQQDTPATPVSVAKPKAAAKPKNFPLYEHSSGQWAKKINGKLFYFGTEQNAALDKYIAQRDDLEAGREPTVARQGQVTLDELVNRFVAVKRDKHAAGELDIRSFKDYKRDAARILDAFGRTRAAECVTSDDFRKLRAKLAETLTPVSLKGVINRIRMVFKYGVDEKLIPVPNYGQSFDRPPQRVLRVARKEKGAKMLTAPQLWALLDLADEQMKAMILLGINCGFGGTDCGTLKQEHLDLEGGYHRYWRRKTGTDRGAPLWPETIAAIETVLAMKRRPAKKEEDRDLVFLTRYGNSWVEFHSSAPITHEFNKLLEKIGIKKKGFSFNYLRHTFPTIGNKARDRDAVEFIMGHTPNSENMVAVYNEEMGDDRLRAVTEYVREWFLAGNPKLAARTAGALAAESSPAVSADAA